MNEWLHERKDERVQDSPNESADRILSCTISVKLFIYFFCMRTVLCNCNTCSIRTRHAVFAFSHPREHHRRQSTRCCRHSCRRHATRVLLLSTHGCWCHDRLWPRSADRWQSMSGWDPDDTRWRSAVMRHRYASDETTTSGYWRRVERLTGRCNDGKPNMRCTRLE